MLRARLSDGRFLIGIDPANLLRLQSGMPLAVDLQELGGMDQFLIVYGQTFAAIIDELERATGRPMPNGGDHAAQGK